MPRRFDLSRKRREVGYLCTKTRDPLDISPTSARDDRPETAGVKTGMNKVEKENGKPVAALSCCASSQPSLCSALIQEALGARIPSLTLSLLQFLPRLVQTNLLSAPCTDTLTPTVNGQVPGFAAHQWLVTPNISVFSCAIETSALTCSPQLCLGARDHEVSFAPCRSSSGFGNQSCFWMPQCWHSMRLFSGHSQ